jgi:hypothetical protein
LQLVDQGSKRCGPVVTVETVNRLIAQGSKAGLMPLLEDLFTKVLVFHPPGK